MPSAAEMLAGRGKFLSVSIHRECPFPWSRHRICTYVRRKSHSSENRQSHRKIEWTTVRSRKAQVVLEFAHGKITNWFGGSSNATTHPLDDMHYRGLLRVARREGGTRVYAIREAVPELPKGSTESARFDAWWTW